MRGALTRLRPRGRADDGSMLIELVVALVVFAVIAAGLAAMSLSVITKTDSNRYRSAAASLLSRDLDTVRATGDAGVPTTTDFTVLPSVSVGGMTYAMTRSAKPWGPGGGTCGVGEQTSVRVVTTVSWTERTSDGTAQQTKAINGSTIITPKDGTYTLGKGSYGVTLYDQDNKPVSGVPVGFTTGAAGTTTGSGATTKTTDTDGCAIATGLTGATVYTAWTGSATPLWVVPGYRHGIDASVFYGKSNTITANTPSNANWVVGKAASITLDVDTDAAHPVPPNVPFTVANQSFTDGRFATKWVSNTTSPLYAPGASGSLTANSFPYLFPSSSGYVPWLGDCADADPGATSGLRGATVATLPASANVGKVNAVKADLTVTGLTANRSLTVTIQHAAHASCSTTGIESYSLTPGNPNVTTTSKTIGFAMPYGTWTITATNNGKTKTGTWTWTGASAGTATQTISLALT